MTDLRRMRRDCTRRQRCLFLVLNVHQRQEILLHHLVQHHSTRSIECVRFPISHIDLHKSTMLQYDFLEKIFRCLIPIASFFTYQLQDLRKLLFPISKFNHIFELQLIRLIITYSCKIKMWFIMTSNTIICNLIIPTK